MENQQPVVYNLNDLIDLYLASRLPEGEKIFKYQSSPGATKWIHIDELRIQANFKAYYSTDHKYIDGFRGMKTTVDDGKTKS